MVTILYVAGNQISALFSDIFVLKYSVIFLQKVHVGEIELQALY